MSEKEFKSLANKRGFVEGDLGGVWYRCDWWVTPAWYSTIELREIFYKEQLNSKDNVKVHKETSSN